MVLCSGTAEKPWQNQCSTSEQKAYYRTDGFRAGTKGQSGKSCHNILNLLSQNDRYCCENLQKVLRLWMCLTATGQYISCHTNSFHFLWIAVSALTKESSVVIYKVVRSAVSYFSLKCFALSFSRNFVNIHDFGASLLVPQNMNVRLSPWYQIWNTQKNDSSS